jgi:hypothetical protein
MGLEWKQYEAFNADTDVYEDGDEEQEVNPALKPLLAHMDSLEAQLKVLEAAPKFRINPNNPEQQKILPAFYAYAKTLSAYKECLKLILAAEKGNEEEESPLRKFVLSMSDAAEDEDDER